MATMLLSSHDFKTVLQDFDLDLRTNLLKQGDDDNEPTEHQIINYVLFNNLDVFFSGFHF